MVLRCACHAHSQLVHQCSDPNQVCAAAGPGYVPPSDFNNASGHPGGSFTAPKGPFFSNWPFNLARNFVLGTKGRHKTPTCERSGLFKEFFCLLPTQPGTVETLHGTLV